MWLSESDRYLLRKETYTRVQSRSWGRSSSPAEERLGAIVFNSPKLIEKLFQKRHLWYWKSLSQ